MADTNSPAKASNPQDHADAQEEEFISKVMSELPKEVFWDVDQLSYWEGFWAQPPIIKSAMKFKSHFQAADEDVLIGSFIKTGTLWLKALCYCIMFKNDQIDRLTKENPHVIVPNIEATFYASKPYPDLYTMPPPRLFQTHLPYRVLPDSIKESTKCKIVYIARNPKDTLISMWHFMNSIYKPNQDPYPLEKAVDSFCKGVSLYGPYFENVLEYWRESQKRPEKILFLKYEDLKKDPKEEVRKLASFLGRPFENEEEAEEVLWRCSLERLKNMEVNQNGLLLNRVPNSFYFRKGVVGDWKNHFIPELENRLNETMHLKLEGTGLDFDQEN